MKNLQLEQLKRQFATEMGIELGADTTARDNGRVGGEMTKALVKLGEQKLQELYDSGELNIHAHEGVPIEQVDHVENNESNYIQ